MPTDHLMEKDDVNENDLEPENQQSISKQSNIETVIQSVVEPNVLETEIPVVKTVKLNQRSSNRLTKRTRKDNTAVNSILKKPVNAKPDTSTVRSKTRRPWELWSVEDKNAFFEALCEYGKDFENIQSYIAQRSKKKGIATNMIKNKDQVRHFYYRTWHKISKFLEISECVQKQTQELYGLINYAELRKKIGGCLNEKNRMKLNELVFSGVTTVKYKGKKLRIKTPVCRALKKLNNFLDAKEPESEKLPKDIFVEFRPHTNAAWLYVQNLAQNPRVRIKACLQKRLRPVIEHLQRRWKPYRLKRKEQLLNSLPNYCPTESSCDILPVLRVKPSREAKIYPLSLSAVDTASSSDVCLEKYIKLSQNSLCKEVGKSKKVSTKSKTQTEKCAENNEIGKIENNIETPNDCDNTLIDLPDFMGKVNKNYEDNFYVDLLTPPRSIPEEQPIDQNLCEALMPSLSLMPVSDPLQSFSSVTDCFNSSTNNSNFNILNSSKDYKADLLTNNKECRNKGRNEINVDLSDCNLEIEPFFNSICLNSKKDLPSSEITEKEINSEKTESSKIKEVSKNSDGVFYKTVKQGWTADDAGFLTFGELYLLLGKPSTIILEYEFEFSETCNSFENVNEGTHLEIPTLLNKIFDLAQVYFTDQKQKQLSGKHGRGSSSKSSKIKICGLTEKTCKDISSSQINHNSEVNLTSKENNSDTHVVVNSVPSVNNSPPSSDKHVFVMPVGTAPRNVKLPDQKALKEEIGKLLPCTRRGCRVRRKPLVVQRPLLPREGMRTVSNPRPMTVVHIVPSVPPLTAVIPPTCPRQKSKVPSAKKIVNILSPGAVDMHPIQVPVIKQIHHDASQNVILQRNSLTSPHVLVNTSSAESMQIINSSINNINVASICETNAINTQKQSQPPAISLTELPPSPDLNTLNLDLLSEHQKNLNELKEAYASLSQISLSDSTNTLSNVSPPTTSFLDEFGLSSKNSSFDTQSNITPSLNMDILSSKECSSSDSSSLHSFKINSEIQWLNGESTELSLNTFLNSMESPSKMTSTLSSNIATENSNLDPMLKLAPVLDSQVRCLLEECSIDLITKFEDLADMINNSSSSDSKPT